MSRTCVKDAAACRPKSNTSHHISYIVGKEVSTRILNCENSRHPRSSRSNHAMYPYIVEQMYTLLHTVAHSRIFSPFQNKIRVTATQYELRQVLYDPLRCSVLRYGEFTAICPRVIVTNHRQFEGFLRLSFGFKRDHMTLSTNRNCACPSCQRSSPFES